MQIGRAPNCGGKRTDGIPPTSSVDRPFITVVIAVFNGTNAIEATIHGLLSQTYKGFEDIVRDGGSTDGTLDIIRKYEHAIDHWLSEQGN